MDGERSGLEDNEALAQEVGARVPARIDFDEWSRLAREAPAEFERRRREVLEAAIAQAPPALQPRLRGLQNRIDLERRRAKTPLGAAVRLHAMMWDEFQKLRAALNRLSAQEPRCAAPAEAAPARVIPFRPRS
jgi:hypothetical protein